MGRSYRIGEVAALTGVSPRALRHYERLGLLRPAGRSEGGQRRYAEADLLRLQQLLTLRYLGFPLRQIGGLLDRPDFDLLAALRAQRGALRERAAELDRIEAALAALLERRLAGDGWDWDLAARAAAAAQHGLTQRATRGEHMDHPYTPEQLERFEALGRELEQRRTPEQRAQVAAWGADYAPEEIRAIEGRWADLLAEVRANLDADPAGPVARGLAERWDALLKETFRGHSAVRDMVGADYQSGALAAPELPGAAEFAFIQRVKAGRG